MRDSTQAYKKISRGGFWFRILPGMRYDLYLGEDHLLLVEQLIFVERYKRFYYGDIQYISVAGSGRSVGFTIAFVLFLLFGAGLPSTLFLFGMHSAALLGIAVLVLAVFGSALIYNLILGPSCIVQIKTATQLRRIPPLERMPTYRKQIIDIQQRILNAQLPSTKEARTA
jgi:hypothetical protein